MGQITDIPHRIVDAGNLSGAIDIHVYESGTSILVDIYSDPGLTVLLANPLSISAGSPVPTLYHGFAGGIRVEVTGGGGTIFDDDPYDRPVGETALASTDSDKGAALVHFKHADADARERTVLSRLLDEVYVTDYDVIGDDAFDDAPGIRNCIAANPGKRIIFPDPPGGAYKLGSSLGEIPPNTRLVGMSRFQTKLRRAYSAADSLMILTNGSGLENLWIDGDGETFTGGGIQCKVGTGRQTVRDVRIINFREGIPIHFPCSGDGLLSSQCSGSQSHWDNIEAWRLDSSAGYNCYAVVHDSPAGTGQTAGHPIHFNHLETSGKESIDFGACNNFFVQGSALFGMKMYTRGVGVSIIGGRVSAGAGGSCPIILSGSGDLVGVHCFPEIIVDDIPGTTWTIVGGWQNNGVTDNNPNSTTTIYDSALHSYSPVFYAGGVPVTIGDGSAVGVWKRDGKSLTFHARLIVGSTTVIPAGSLTVSLPSKCNGSIWAQCNVQVHLTVAGSIYKAAGRIASGELVARLERDTTGPLTNASPAAIVVGSIIMVSGSYAR